MTRSPQPEAFPVRPLTSRQRARRLSIVKQIQTDIATDTVELEGKPFNGDVVAVYLGKLAAAVHGLARIVESMLAEQLAEDTHEE